jgi:hypothetical protein
MLPDGTRIFYSGGRKYLIRPGNYDVENEEDKAHLERIHAEAQMRKLQTNSTTHAEDYADVFYWPYESFYKVDTEVCNVFLHETGAIFHSRLIGTFFRYCSIISAMKEHKLFLPVGRSCIGAS